MIQNTLKTTLFLSILAGLFIGIGYFFGGNIGIIIGFTISLLINFFSYWYSDKIVLKMHNAKEVKSGRLYNIVKDLSQKAYLPMPKVYEVHTPSPNAFATGRNPKHAAVACSLSLIQILTDDELTGVMAHELTHIKNRDTLIQTIAVSFASAIAIIAEMIQWMAIFGLGGNDDESGAGSWAGMIAIMILAPLIATIIQFAISRQREYMADAGAIKLTKSPYGLINALIKLEETTTNINPNIINTTTSSLYIINPFRMSTIAALFSTHPSTEDRIKRLKKIRII